MRGLKLTVLAVMLVIFCVAGEALARGRFHRHHHRHYHHNPRTSFHFGISAYVPPLSFSWYAPYTYYGYAGPYYYPSYSYGSYADYPYRTYANYPSRSYAYAPVRRYGLVFDFPVAAWSSLNDVDRVYASNSTYRALEVTRSGETVAWHNPETGASGSVSPRPAFKNTQGQDCRDFEQTVNLGGQAQSAYGTACRQPDGSWRIIQ